MSITQLSFPRVEIADCEVCGSAEIEVDEVQSGGRLLLALCGRCDHRFTARVGSSRVSRARCPQADAGAEVATAA